MSITGYVAWLVWCSDCHDVHHISHLRTNDHGKSDPEQAWQRVLDKIATWGS
jgi:hypothetical protein